jgi:hypothetical protein
MKEEAVLMGPFVGEMYWEAARFAPMLPNMIRHKYKKRKIKYVILTREDRFDLYGRCANILVPLKIPGDYKDMSPECFKLKGLKLQKYEELAKQFKQRFSKRFNIVQHIYPDAKKGRYDRKNQFPNKSMNYIYKPRQENYDLVEKYLPNDRPLVVLAPRYRDGFQRNWKRWPDFYNLLWQDKDLISKYNFIVCGKEGEYIPDPKNRFFDMNTIPIGDNSSLIGILLAILKKTHFTFGSQSAIPNLSLLFGVEVLEFGCQKRLHTVTYNVKNTPITFIENRGYNIEPTEIMKHMRRILKKKEKKK